MTDSADGGWSFEEALARTSDPQLWDRYQVEIRQQPATPTDLRPALIADLLGKIDTKLFAAKPKSSDGGWTMLDRVVVEKRMTKANEDEIRLFVPVKAPNAVEHLRNRGLAEGFLECVRNDPELTAVLKRCGTPDCLEGDRSPNWFIDYHWPLGATAGDFQRRIMATGIIDFDRQPTREIVAISELLVDRISAFRGLLVSGQLQALGLTADFSELFVAARLWGRKNLSIDVANGDLCEDDDRGNFSPILTSVELRASTTVAVQREEAVSQPKVARNRSAKRQEIERIVTEYGIDVGISGRKGAVSEIMPHMKKPPTSETEKRALETMVARIWQERINEER